jgi:3-oxoacyl-[acyl-carrier protein] reductase
MEDTPENRRRFIATIPTGRFSTPEDVANACLYLASDEARFVAGVCLGADGGRCV